jgi:hypothetical protein
VSGDPSTLSGDEGASKDMGGAKDVRHGVIGTVRSCWRETCWPVARHQTSSHLAALRYAWRACERELDR